MPLRLQSASHSKILKVTRSRTWPVAHMWSRVWSPGSWLDGAVLKETAGSHPHTSLHTGHILLDQPRLFSFYRDLALGNRTWRMVTGALKRDGHSPLALPSLSWPLPTLYLPGPTSGTHTHSMLSPHAPSPSECHPNETPLCTLNGTGYVLNLACALMDEHCQTADTGQYASASWIRPKVVVLTSKYIPIQSRINS